MLDRLEIKEKLGLKDDSEWDNRHFLPSSRSGFVIRPEMTKRKSIIRDLADRVVVKTNIVIKTPKNCPNYYKRFWDNLLDWECVDRLNERNDKLIEVAKGRGRAEVVKLLERERSTNIVHPQDIDGYDPLSAEDRFFLRLLFVYNGIPDREEVIRTLMFVDGIGKQKADKFYESKIYLYEDLIKNSDYNIFTFNVCRNHLLEFKALFEVIYETLFRKRCDIDITVAGSLGRGRKVGHDIDLLFHERDKEKVVEIMSEMAYRVIGQDKNYNVILCDTFVRIDIAFYNDINRVTYFFHYFGTKEMNIFMRKKANMAGYTLSQNGLIRGSETIYPKSDAELFKLIGVSGDPRLTYWEK